MKRLLLILPLSGCASSGLDANYDAYLRAHTAATQSRRPMVELVAQQGQTIELRGVERFAVYAPDSGPSSAPAMYIAPRSQALDVLQSAIGVAGTVGGIVAGGNAAAKLATTVGSAAAAGYRYVQAPAANVTSIAGNGVIGSGVHAVGSNNTDSSNRSATDSHAIDSHAVSDNHAVQTDSHAVSTDSHAVQTDNHAVTSDDHSVSDNHAVATDNHAVNDNHSVSN